MGEYLDQRDKNSSSDRTLNDRGKPKQQGTKLPNLQQTEGYQAQLRSISGSSNLLSRCLHAPEQPIQANQSENKTGIPDKMKTNAEHYYGVNMNHGKVHYNSSKPALLEAHAYSQGLDIFIAPGKEKYLPHEVCHLGQFLQGRVKATTKTIGGVNINDNPSLETEADVIGEKISQMGSTFAQVPKTEAPQVIQAKLAIGQPGDKYEQEADAMARQVVQIIHQPQSQIQPESLTEEDNLQAQVDTNIIQSKKIPQSRLHSQRMVQCRVSNGEMTTPQNLEASIQLARSGGQTTDLLLQRVPVAPTATPATYHNVSDIYAMTLNQFDSYARKQADWATSPALNQLSDIDKDTLRWTLEFGRSEFILNGCGEMTVQTLKDAVTASVKLDSLYVYSRAVSRGVETIELQQTNDIDKALKWGTALIKLEGTLGGSLIKRIFNESFNQLEYLIDANGGVEIFIEYCQTCKPMLMADNGAEIRSYLMLLDESVYPQSYMGRVSGVRNFHRFEKRALEQLAINAADTSKTKPFSLILHSGLDHNGAFHRDPALTAAITDNRNLTLMIEGESSLQGIQDQLAGLAGRYGQQNRISQVMIAAHGTSKTMDLAGSVNANGQIIQKDLLDVRILKTSHTNAFFNELLGNMDSSADGRIVLNACLTAANKVEVRLDADPAKAKEQINIAIVIEPSLATRIRQLVGGMQTTVVGVSGSFSVGSNLIDPVTGRFDIIPTSGGTGSAGDTHLTDSDKFNYVRHAKDPQGALIAVVECWATDEARTLQKVTERHTELAASRKWEERLIHACYGIILANPRNANLMNDLAACSSYLHALGFNSGCTNTGPARVSNLRLLHRRLGTHLHTIFGELATATSGTYSKLVMYQGWMLSDSTKRANFLTELSSIFNCQIAVEYINIREIGNTELAALLPPPSTAGSAPYYELMLALIGVMQGNNTPSDACYVYLHAVIGSGGRTFPSRLGVNGLLGGLSSETGILELIGLGSSASTGSAPPALNVDLDGDGVNDFYVEPMTRRGTTARYVFGLNVRQRPEGTEPVLRMLPMGTIFVIGQSGDWYAIEYNNGTAFVQKSRVRLQRVF